MLRIFQNRSAASAKSYYSHSDYLSEGQELAGLWRGETAKLLGLSGLVEGRDFDALCDNLDPRTMQPLTSRTKQDRTTGYDFNFHSPKGLSLAYAISGDERILDAFRQSVHETMQEIEADAQTRVRKGGKQENRTTSNLAWAEFIHTTARPVDGLPDPHLHAHCFTFNATFDALEGRFKAAQFRNLKRDAPYYEAAFHARLAERVKGLGYTIERSAKGWDIANVAQPLRKRFSRRTDQIEKLARQAGITDPAQKEKLGAKSRQKKVKSLPWQELRQAWLDRLSSEEQRLLLELPQQVSLAPKQPPEITAAEAMSHAVSHCFEREAVAPERSVLAEALRRGVGDVSPSALRREVDGSGVIRRDIDGRRYATTRAVLDEEKAVLEFVRQRRGQEEPLNANWQLRDARFSEDQRTALQQILTSPDSVQLLFGGAGVGKTTLLQEMVAAIEAGGRDVLTFAPSNEASRKVLREEGFSQATTVAELLVNRNLQGALAGNVILIDEAGLLGTKELRQVLDLAKTHRARVILSGDHRQHGSVSRGGLLRVLETYGGLKPAKVSTIQRQRGRYKDAVAAIAAGQLETGFNILDQLGWIHELPDETRYAALAKDYADALDSGASALAIAPTNREAEQATSSIRTELRSRGKLEQQSQELLRLRPLHFTAAQRRDPVNYHPGDVLVFQQNAPGHKKGERIALASQPDAALLQHAERFSVYRAETLDLSIGDRIRLTGGGQTVDGKRLNNGGVFTLAGYNSDGNLILNSDNVKGWIVDRNYGFLSHGWVQTSHSSQGRTVDQIYIAVGPESFAAASQEGWYVSVSRGRHSAHVYVDDKLALQEAIQHSSQKLTASELLREELPQLQRRRRATARARAQQLTPTPQKQKEFAHG